MHGDVPEPVSFYEAERASRNYPGFEEHEYATCFVCGPNRDDGLGLFAGAVDGTKVFAAPWIVPDDVSRLLVWAALDCPGAIGVGWDGRGDWLLGRMAAEVHEVPEPGQQCVVVAWPVGHQGRKGFAGTALYRGNDLLARARQTWITLTWPSDGSGREAAAWCKRSRIRGRGSALASSTTQADRVQVLGQHLLDARAARRASSCSAWR